jgi:hypothetical protein
MQDEEEEEQCMQILRGDASGGNAHINYTRDEALSQERVNTPQVVMRDIAPGEAPTNSLPQPLQERGKKKAVAPEISDDTWALIMARYGVDGPCWTDGSEYAMFKDGKPDPDFMATNTAASVRETEMILRPLIVALKGFKMGRLNSAPIWSAKEEYRLAEAGIFVLDTRKVFVYEADFLVALIHVNWRFFVCIILKGDGHSEGEREGRTFLGYHYYAVDKNTAITNNCL